VSRTVVTMVATLFERLFYLIRADAGETDVFDWGYVLCHVAASCSGDQI
jgi:hypothetical protein